MTSEEWFQLSGWITSAILGITGMVITAVGWSVRGKQAKSLAIKKDIHDSIDKTIKSLTDLEDAVFSFWSEPESKTRLDQIINLHRRLLTNLKQLAHLKDSAIPSVDVMNLRKQATLDAETSERPIPTSDERLSSFSRSVNKILDSKLLTKSWSE